MKHFGPSQIFRLAMLLSALP